MSRPVRLPPLRDGETPWDSMPAEELRFEVVRMYQALTAARSALAVISTGDESPYWGPNGSGGAALLVADSTLAPYEARDEEIYDAYFRMRPYPVERRIQSARRLPLQGPDRPLGLRDGDGAYRHGA